MTIKHNHKISQKKCHEFRGQLLAWYDTYRRVLPWRAIKGQTAEPYYVWLSEIMLQQTTVGAVGPYFTKFIETWPTIHDLAGAPQDEVMSAWAGLGYYARARNLYKCAQIVANDFNGQFPQTPEELKTLPGIGDYTSAAIAAIAFNKAATVVDGNIERIMARYFAVKDPLPKAKPYLRRLAAGFFKGFAERPGDLAQALMDLGATICIPKTPRCALCPVSAHCKGRAQDIAHTLPRKEKKGTRPQRYGHIYWVENDQGEVLLHKRPDQGLLGGMLGLPTSAWENKGDTPIPVIPAFLKDTPKDITAQIFHTFTHFDLELALKKADCAGQGLLDPQRYIWVDKRAIEPQAFPTVFRKALNIFLKQKA